MTAAFIAGFHYLGIMLLTATLLVEWLALRTTITREVLDRLVRIDILYGISAVVILVTGFLRITTAYGKGPVFYMHSMAFHTKVGLFILIGLISIVPTIRFLRWRKAAQANGSLPDAAAVNGTRKLVLVELHILFLLPFLAAIMARGIM
ncbi:DUF2214 family protein [Alcanivorax sp. JB21]|uniref:DUF2214 family protein n=1 Tax=Alcanivorax limicola TaxID=2874102 RepID=UPI001CBFDEC8|nr:DUF2214 family protein [Alcanivorax limicola]MBZ2190022.1 DUF2214 family protein [Alcanivorax limicola]